GGLGHDADGHIALGHDLETHPGAIAQNLADGGHQQQGQGVADAHADAVDGGVNDGVLAGEHLGAAQNDAVDDDQGDEHAHGVVQALGKGLHHHLYDGDEAGDDNDVAGQVDLGGDDLAQHRDDDVGHHQHEGEGRAHAERVRDRGGQRQGRAGTQHQAENRVLLD